MRSLKLQNVKGQLKMFEDALIILKKELKNLFKDRRTIFSIFILPLILMPVIFGLIGFVERYQQKAIAKTVYLIEIRNSPGSQFTNILSKYIDYKQVPITDNASMVQEKNDYIIIAFPKNIDTAGSKKYAVKIYYRSTSQKSVYAAQSAVSALNTYSSKIVQKKLKAYNLSLQNLSPIKPVKVDVALPSARGNDFIANMIPYLLLIFIFSGTMNVGLAATAGEKERGGLVSLLVNQVSRTSIALGKVLYILIAGSLNTFSSFIGLLIAFNLPGALPINMRGHITIGSSMALMVVLLATAILAASIIVFLGSLARNIKEAGGYIMPAYIVAIVIGVATMSMESTKNLAIFLIPFANMVFAMKGIIMSQLSIPAFLITIGVNLFLTLLVVYAIAKLFNSEKIMNANS